MRSEKMLMLPSDWEKLPLRRLVDVRVSNIDKRSVAGQPRVQICNYTDVYSKGYITDASSFMVATAQREQINRLRLRPGDVLITKDSESYRDIARPALIAAPLGDDVVCGYHLALLRPHSIDGHFLYWALESVPVNEQFSVLAKGVTRFGLTTHAIKSVLIPVPPNDIQTRASTFLVSATQAIEEAVAAQRRLVSLLEEEKQAMISAALGISSGLSPQGFAPFRDANGLSQPVRLKNLLTEVAKRSTTGQGQLFSLRKGIGLVATGSVYGKEVAPEQLVGYKRVEAGQLVMNRMRASTGLFGVAPSDGLVSPDYAVYRVSPQVDPEFLVAVLRLPQFGAVIRANSKGLGTGASGFMRVYSEQLGQLTVPVPPLAEQRRIVAEITENGRRIDQAIDSHERQIALLDEYRARLVADVVTGKLDVRELADDLPELEVTESSLLASREGSQLEDVV